MLMLTFKSSRQTGTLMTLLDSQDSVVLQISLDNYRVSLFVRLSVCLSEFLLISRLEITLVRFFS